MIKTLDEEFSFLGLHGWCGRSSDQRATKGKGYEQGKG